MHINIYLWKDMTHDEVKNYQQELEAGTLLTNGKVMNKWCKLMSIKPL